MSQGAASNVEKLEPNQRWPLFFIYIKKYRLTDLFTRELQYSATHRCKISDTAMAVDPLDSILSDYYCFKVSPKDKHSIDEPAVWTFGGKLKQKDKASNLWYRRKTFPDIAEGQIYPGSTRHSVPGTSMCQEAPRLVQQYKKAEASRDVQLSGVDDLGQKSGETIQHWSMSVVSDWAKKNIAQI